MSNTPEPKTPIIDKGAAIPRGQNPGHNPQTIGVQSLPGRNIRILGVPLDLGQSRRGVDMGPSAVRVAGLEARLEALGHHVEDGGNIAVDIAETQNIGEHKAKYLHAITETCTREAQQILEILAARQIPLVL